jgi:biopolymer transport protein ExbD
MADLPMSELNTTPLIDVMLVLLIMFIVTVPIATHKVPLDLPQRPGTRASPSSTGSSSTRLAARRSTGSPSQTAICPARLGAIAAEPSASFTSGRTGKRPMTGSITFSPRSSERA